MAMNKESDSKGQLHTLELSELEQIVRPVLFKGRPLENGEDIAGPAALMRILMLIMYGHHCCNNGVAKAATNAQDPSHFSSSASSTIEPVEVVHVQNSLDAVPSAFHGFHDLASEEWVRTKVIPNCISMLLSRKATLLGAHGWNINIPRANNSNQPGLVFHRCVNDGKSHDTRNSDMILGAHEIESWNPPPVFLEACKSMSEIPIPLHMSLILEFIELTCALFRCKGINIVEDSDWLNVLHRAFCVSSNVTLERETYNNDDSDNANALDDLHVSSLGVSLYTRTTPTGTAIILEKYRCSFGLHIPMQYFIFQGGLDAIHLCLAQRPIRGSVATTNGSLSARAGGLEVDVPLDQNKSLTKDSSDCGYTPPCLPRPSLFGYSLLLDLFDARIRPFITKTRDFAFSNGHPTQDERLRAAKIFSGGFFDFLRSFSPDVDINGTSDRNLFLSILHDLHNIGIMLSAAHGNMSFQAVSANTCVPDAKWMFLLECPEHSVCKSSAAADPSAFALLLRLEGIYKMIKSSSIQNKIAGIMELRVVIDNVETESKNHCNRQQQAPHTRESLQWYHERSGLPINQNTSPSMRSIASPHRSGENDLGFSLSNGLAPVGNAQWQPHHVSTTPVSRGWSSVPPSSPTDLSTARDYAEANSSDDADVVVDHMSNGSENMTGPAQDLFLLHQGIKRSFDVGGYEDTDEGSTKACCSDDEIRDDATASDDEIRGLMTPSTPSTPPSGPALPKRPPNTGLLHSQSKSLARSRREIEPMCGNGGKRGISFIELFDSDSGETRVEMDMDCVPCDAGNPSSAMDKDKTESSKSRVIIGGNGARVAATEGQHRSHRPTVQSQDENMRPTLRNEACSSRVDHVDGSLVPPDTVKQFALGHQEQGPTEAPTKPAHIIGNRDGAATAINPPISTDADLTRVSDCIYRSKLLLEDHEYYDAHLAVLQGIEMLEEFQTQLLGDSLVLSSSLELKSELLTLKAVADDGILKKAIVEKFLDLTKSDRHRVVNMIQEYIEMLPEDSAPVASARGTAKKNSRASSESIPLAFARQHFVSPATVGAKTGAAEAYTASMQLRTSIIPNPDSVSLAESTREEATMDQLTTGGAPKYHHNISTLLDFFLFPRRVLLHMAACSYLQADVDDRSMLQLLTSPEYLHPQLLKRFLHILHFLGEYHCIVPADLHSLWDAAIHPPSNQHESIQKTLIYDMWIPLLRGNKLNGDQLTYLYREISNALFRSLPTESESSTPYEKPCQTNPYSVEEPRSANVIAMDLMIPVVVTFADATFGIIFMARPQSPDEANALGGEAEELVMTPVGLDLLWRLANEEAPCLSRDLQDQVVRHLMETAMRLLANTFTDFGTGSQSFSSTEEKRNKASSPPSEKKWWFSTFQATNWLLHRSIEDLRLTSTSGVADANRSRLRNGTVCHMVLCKILSLWPQSRTPAFGAYYPTRSEIVQRYDILKILIDELRHYCAIVDCCLMSRDKAQLDVDRAVWVGNCYAHVTTIQTCLDLIRLITSYEIASIQKRNGHQNIQHDASCYTIMSSNQPATESGDPAPDGAVGSNQRKRLREHRPDGTQSTVCQATRSTKKDAFAAHSIGTACNSSVAIVIDDDEDDDTSSPARDKRVRGRTVSGVEKEVGRDEVIILDCETPPANPTGKIPTDPYSPFRAQEASAFDTCSVNVERWRSAPAIGCAANDAEEYQIMSIDTLELLWTTLMEQERSPVERALCCEMLLHILKMAVEAAPPASVQRFSSTLLEFFFRQGGFDPANTNCPALDLLALCLQCLPAASHDVPGECKEEMYCENECDTLIGADYLWKVILSASSDVVASRAIGLLAQMYLDPPLYNGKHWSQVIRLQSLFARECMEKLRFLAFSDREDADESLLRADSETFAGRFKQDESRGSRILELLFVFASGILRGFDESGAVLSRNVDGENPENNKMCKLSHRSLSAAGLSESRIAEKNDSTSCLHLKLPYTSSVSSTKLAPIAELLKRESFSLLFDICGKSNNDVNSDKKERSLAWEFLMLLPTDPFLFDSLCSNILTPGRQPMDSDWATYLPHASISPFRLLYGLQIVEVVLGAVFRGKHAEAHSAQSSTLPVIQDVPWSLVNHLISVLCEIDLSLGATTTTGGARCRQGVIILHCVYKLQRLLLFCFTRSGGAKPQLGVVVADDQLSVSSHITPDGYLMRKLIRHAANTVHSAVELHEMQLLLNGNPTNGSGMSSLDGSSTEDMDSEVIMVTKQSLRLMQYICEDVNPTLIDVLFKGISTVENIHSIIAARALAAAILRSTSSGIREMACSVFLAVFLRNRNRGAVGPSDSMFDALSSGSSSNEDRFLALLINMIPLVAQNDGLTFQCSSLFQLLNSVVDQMWNDSLSLLGESAIRNLLLSDSESLFSSGSDLPRTIGVQSFGNLLKWVMTFITDQPIRENRMSAQTVDYLLVGMLTLAEKLTRSLCVQLNVHVGCQKDFLQYIFIGLFDVAHISLDDVSCSPPLFKTNESRGAAMALLTTLWRSSLDNASLLSELLLRRHAETSPRTDLMDEWYADPIGKDKSPTGYVGLRNLGCTCYLNSLMQQLFLIAPFCDGILSCDPTKGGESSSEENMLHQLQLLFAYLSISERRDYDPSGLVSTIKGYDGNPIRLGEQQDVDEFFNLFGDRLERSLRALPQKRLLQDTFGGQISHIITCQDCKSRSERREDYLSLSLDVKGKQNILRSLDLYVEGEALDGSNQYFCENCQAKRDSVKMACIRTLPNVLILHLKRFEFDLELMRKVKLNERCEFPLLLNMYPYTMECLSMQAAAETEEDGSSPQRQPEYFEYFLRGVLVHSGTADSGHYYSIARKNVSSKEEPWYCFNDSSVSPFDVSTLPEAAFGGSGEKQKFDKTYSAYLLFYQRKHVEFQETLNPVEARGDKHESPEALRSSLWHPDFHGKSDPRKNIPPTIYESLVKENALFLRDKVFFDPVYSSWLQRVSEISQAVKVDCHTSLNIVKVLTYQLLDILAHARGRGATFESFVKILCSCYSSNNEACAWLLEAMAKTQVSWTEAMLLRCPVAELRQDFVRILSVAFLSVAPAQRHLYGFSARLDRTSKKLCVVDGNCRGASPDDENEDDPFATECTADMDDDMVVRTLDCGSDWKSVRLGRVLWWKSRSFLIRFVGNGLLEHLIGCESSWRRFDQLFEALYAFASCGSHEALFLVRCGLIMRLLDIYLGDSGGVPKVCLIGKKRGGANDRRPKMGDKYSHPNFTPLLTLLQRLIQSAVVPQLGDADSDSISDSDDEDNIVEHSNHLNNEDILQEIKRTLPPTLTDDALSLMQSWNALIELPSRDINYISNKFLINAWGEQELEPPRVSCSSADAPIKSIVKHLCFENIRMTEVICELAQEQFRDRKANEFTCALDSLFSLRDINDQHSLRRNSCVIEAVVAGVNENIKYEKEACTILCSLRDAVASVTSKVKVRTCDKDFFEQLLFDRFPSVFIEEWFRRPNTMFEVRHCIIEVIKAFIGFPQQNKHCEFKSDSQNGASSRKREATLSLGQGSPAEKRLKQDLSSVLDETGSGATTDQRHDGGNATLVCLCDPLKVKERVLSYLITIFSDIREAIESQASSKKNEPYVDSRAFSPYFETLRLCLSGAEDEKPLFLSKFHGVNKQIASLLWKIDEEGRSGKRPYEDIAKGELILLYESVIELHPEAGYELISDFAQSGATPKIEYIDVDEEETQATAARTGEGEDDDSSHISKLLEVYVTANNGRSNEWYNNKYIYHYYRLLVLLAGRHPAFRRKLLDHGNWRWALRAFVVGETGSDSGPISELLMETSVMYAGEDEGFRASLVPFLFMYDRDKVSLITQRGKLETCALYLACVMLRNDTDQQGPGEVMKLIVGNEHGGLSQLSEAAAKFLEKVEEFEDPGKRTPASIEEELAVALTGLSLALECIRRILDKHGQRKMRDLFSFWPEADDVNVLCHKLVTIGDEEWGENYGVSRGTELFDDKDHIVSHAERILTMLNSVQQ